VHATSCLLVTTLLVGCEDRPASTQPQPPAATVPHGTIDLTSNTATITPRARAITALQTNAQTAGHRFFILEDNNSPLAAVIEIDLRKFEPVLLTRPEGIRPVLAVAEPYTSVVVGSGFQSLVQVMEPLGLVQYEGRVLSGIEQHGYTRILGISAESGRFGVVHRSEWLPETFYSALQAGPGIIEQGKLDISERDLQRSRYFRSFIAECGDYALTGVSLVPTHLYTLGGALVDLFARENLQCNEVVNLAGIEKPFCW